MAQHIFCLHILEGETVLVSVLLLLKKKTKKLHHENSNIHFGKISSVNLLCYSLQFRLKVSPPCTSRDQLSVWPRWTDRDGSGSLILNNLFHLSIKASDAAA